MLSLKLLLEAQAFQSWYFALCPGKLGLEADMSRYEAIVSRTARPTPFRSKKALRGAIELARQDPAIMNDPATELGYLIRTRFALADT
jgi:hypothetical protein